MLQVKIISQSPYQRVTSKPKSPPELSRAEEKLLTVATRARGTDEQIGTRHMLAWAKAFLPTAFSSSSHETAMDQPSYTVAQRDYSFRADNGPRLIVHTQFWTALTRFLLRLDAWCFLVLFSTAK